MKDRIQIDGVWYVRQQDITEEKDYTHYNGIVVENEDFCFDFTTNVEHDHMGLVTRYYGASVKITDKRLGGIDEWQEDYWDNDVFLKGIVERNKKSIDSLEEAGFGEKNNKILIELLEKAKEKGYL